MKILFITEQLPYPLDSGGRIRTFHILKGLAQHHSITLVTSSNRDSLKEPLDILGSFCSSVRICTAIKTSPLARAKHLMSCAINDKPAWLFLRYNKMMGEMISSVIDEGYYDAVHYDHLDATIYEKCLRRDCATILDEHNIVTNQIRTTAKSHSSPLMRFALKAEANKIRRYEASQIAKMTMCLVCSEADRDSLFGMVPSTHAVSIPNGVDLSYFRPSPKIRTLSQDQQPRNIVFVGSLDYLPCAIAVEFFLRDILPSLREIIPNVQFYIVGSNPSIALRRLAESIPNVVLTGRVADTRPYLIDADVSVVPILSGSGTRLKILEAMAMGVPVVSTTIGAEGLFVENNRHLLLADTARAFAQAIAKLLTTPALAENIRKNALSLVRTCYSWDIIQRQLLSAYESIR